MAYGDLPYGEGLYKGVGETSSAVVVEQPVEMFSEDAKLCLILGLEDEHGGGWSQRDGESWVWPTSVFSITQLFDHLQQVFNVGLCSRDGLFYALNTIDGVEVEIPYKDKVDPLIANSGIDIEADIFMGEVSGGMRHYDVYDLSSHLQFRPSNPDNIDAPGFDEDGLFNDFQVDVLTRQNGKPDTVSSVTDVPINEDIVQQRTVNGKSHQLIIHTNKSGFKITAVEQYCKVNDRTSSFDNGSSGSDVAQYQAALSVPSLWLSRGRLLLNRTTGRTLPGRALHGLGVDNRSDGAFTIIDNPLTIAQPFSYCTIMLWYRIADTVDFSITYDGGELEITPLPEYDKNGFRFVYFHGAIPDEIYLPSGVGYSDVRLYNSTVSVDAIRYYCDNVINHNGDVFLP